jgi:pilus assembly protein Flp/PilA
VRGHEVPRQHFILERHARADNSVSGRFDKDIVAGTSRVGWRTVPGQERKRLELPAFFQRVASAARRMARPRAGCHAARTKAPATSRRKEEPRMRRIRSWLRALRSEDGQGMTEYIVIVGLVAIAAIGVVTVFGNEVRALFGAAADGLNGEKNEIELGGAKGTDGKVTLQNFNEHVAGD